MRLSKEPKKNANCQCVVQKVFIFMNTPANSVRLHRSMRKLQNLLNYNNTSIIITSHRSRLDFGNSGLHTHREKVVLADWVVHEIGRMVAMDVRCIPSLQALHSDSGQEQHRIHSGDRTELVHTHLQSSEKASRNAVRQAEMFR